MPDYRLRIGMRFRQQAREYVIEQGLPDNHLKVRDISSSESSVKTRSELITALFEGKLELAGDTDQSELVNSRMRQSRITDLSQLADDDPLRAEALRRFEYVKSALSGPAIRGRRDALTPVIRNVSDLIQDRRPPSWVTLYRWVRDYEAAGNDIRALVPANRARGNRRSKISGKKLDQYGESEYEKARTVDHLIDQVIRTRYLSSNRPTVRSVYENLQARIIDENRLRPPHDQLPIPHISSLYRRVERFDPYEVACARFGRKYAREKYQVNQQGPRPAHLLERVECDHTRLDLMVVDTDTRLPLGRPWLTTMLDVYSRMVLGMYLSFHPPSYLSVMQCLRHAIKPKDYVKEAYPEIEHDWPAYGLPELLVVDNGKEFHSRHFEDACLQLGIVRQYAPPECAWYKGTVERWFGTQNTRLLHELPGTTFSDIFDRGDYDPQKNAVISLDAVLELVHTWIIDLYHQQVQRGVRDIPYRKWREAVQEWPPNLPSRVEELNVLSGCVEKRRISNSGIELFTLHYNCPELGLIRRSQGRGEKVQLKYDPNDLSVIHVLDLERGRYIPVPAIDQHYTSHLTLWQHEVIRKYARRFVSEHLDAAALCRARKRIEEIVARERVTQRHLTTRQKVARFLNLGQPDYSHHQNGKRPAQTYLPAPSCAGQQLTVKETEQNLLPASATNSGIADSDTSLLTAVALDAAEKGLVIDETGWSADYNLPQQEETL